MPNTRLNNDLKLSGELIGARWEGIYLEIPAGLGEEQVIQIVRDLETFFSALKLGYLITRKVGTNQWIQMLAKSKGLLA